MDKFLFDDLQLISCREYKVLQDFQFPEGWIIVLLLLSGSAEIHTPAERLVLSGGEAIIILPPSMRLALISPATASTVCFTQEFAISNQLIKTGRGYLNHVFHHPVQKIKLSKEETERLAAQITDLRKKALNGAAAPFAKEMVLLGFNLLLYEISALYVKQYPTNTGRASRKELLFLQFIEQVRLYCRQEHSVRFYADALFVTPGYLGKVVRDVSKGSAKQFIEMAIVAEAYMLLSNPSLSIAAITEALHFSSISSFSNFFKRYARVSPRIYREFI